MQLREGKEAQLDLGKGRSSAINPTPLHIVYPLVTYCTSIAVKP